MAAETLASWIERELRPRYGTMGELATHIGMSESGLVRGMKTGTLSVENLLQLARRCNEPPSRVLALAGKQHVAALIEALYGDGMKALTDSERAHLDRWRRASARARRNLEALLVQLIDEEENHTNHSTKRG